MEREMVSSPHHHHRTRHDDSDKDEDTQPVESWYSSADAVLQRLERQFAQPRSPSSSSSSSPLSSSSTYSQSRHFDWQIGLQDTRGPILALAVASAATLGFLMSVIALVLSLQPTKPSRFIQVEEESSPTSPPSSISSSSSSLCLEPTTSIMRASQGIRDDRPKLESTPLVHRNISFPSILSRSTTTTSSSSSTFLLMSPCPAETTPPSTYPTSLVSSSSLLVTSSSLSLPEPPTLDKRASTVSLPPTTLTTSEHALLPNSSPHHLPPPYHLSLSSSSSNSTPSFPFPPPLTHHLNGDEKTRPVPFTTSLIPTSKVKSKSTKSWTLSNSTSKRTWFTTRPTKTRDPSSSSASSSSSSAALLSSSSSVGTPMVKRDRHYHLAQRHYFAPQPPKLQTP